MNRLLLTIVSFCVLQPLMAMEIVPFQQKGLTIYKKHMQLQEKRSNDTIQTKLNTELINANKQGLEFHRKLISEQKNSNFDALQAELDTKLVSAIKQGSVFYEQLMVQQGNPTNDALRKKLNIQLISCSKVLIINKPVLQISYESDEISYESDEEKWDAEKQAEEDAAYDALMEEKAAQIFAKLDLLQTKIKAEIDDINTLKKNNDQLTSQIANLQKSIINSAIVAKHPTPQNTTWFNHGYTWCINNPKKAIVITLGTGIVAYYAYNLWSNSPSSHSPAPCNVVEQTGNTAWRAAFESKNAAIMLYNTLVGGIGSISWNAWSYVADGKGLNWLQNKGHMNKEFVDAIRNIGAQQLIDNAKKITEALKDGHNLEWLYHHKRIDQQLFDLIKTSGLAQLFDNAYKINKYHSKGLDWLQGHNYINDHVKMVMQNAGANSYFTVSNVIEITLRGIIIDMHAKL